jgi:hypothetical protein
MAIVEINIYLSAFTGVAFNFLLGVGSGDLYIYDS